LQSADALTLRYWILGAFVNEGMQKDATLMRSIHTCGFKKAPTTKAVIF